MTTRVCTKCGLEKDLEEFAIDNRTSTGRASICAKCKSDYVNKYNKEHREELNSYNKNRNINKVLERVDSIISFRILSIHDTITKVVNGSNNDWELSVQLLVAKIKVLEDLRKELDSLKVK